jgi:hypothetical protein
MGNFPSVVKKAFDKLFGLKQMRVRLRTRTSALCRHVETRSLCARELNTDGEFVVVGHFRSQGCHAGSGRSGQDDNPVQTPHRRSAEHGAHNRCAPCAA